MRYIVNPAKNFSLKCYFGFNKFKEML